MPEGSPTKKVFMDGGFCQTQRHVFPNAGKHETYYDIAFHRFDIILSLSTSISTKINWGMSDHVHQGPEILFGRYLARNSRQMHSSLVKSNWVIQIPIPPTLHKGLFPPTHLYWL